MAVPYAADLEDPYAVAGSLPENAGPAPEPTVLTPLGQLPASALPPDQGPPPDVQPSPDMAPVTPAGQPPGAGAAGAPAPESAPAAGALPPPPVEPTLTGDPHTDLANNIAYTRALREHYDRQHQVLTQSQQGVIAEHAAKELEAERQAQAAREKMRQEQEAARQDYQRSVIGKATQERADAMGALENGTWRSDPHSGTKIAALILGAVGAGFSAAGGHPTGNLAAEAIEKITQREYDTAKTRLANASDAVLQARYGYKDLQDNQRAALNDIDADAAAKQRLIAKETASALAQRGATPEQIQSNDLYQGAMLKASQHEGDIHLREIEAGRKAELTGSQVEHNEASARAADALADWRNRRPGGPGRAGAGKGTGGKAAVKVQKDELKDIENAAKKYTDVMEGSAKSPGIKTSYESANAVVNELKRAAASGDPDAMKIAVMHAQEQSTRFLTGAAPTQQTFEIQHALAGSPEQLEAKFGGLVGRPTEAKSYVLRMAQNIDAISRQRKEVMDRERESLDTRLNSVVKSDEGRRRAQGIVDSLFGKGGGEQAARPRKTIGGGIVYEKGEDGLWHKVASPAPAGGDIKL